MFRIIFSIFLLCVTETISAQVRHDANATETSEKESTKLRSAPELNNNEYGVKKVPEEMLPSDSLSFQSQEPQLHLPTLTERGTMPQMGYPWTWYGGWMNYWKLHEGMNLSLGASVFSTFGSGNTWSGAGFGQNVSMMYTMPFKNSKWSFALGGYFTNTIWAHDSYRELGVSGILDYKFNDKWNAYLYGQKSIVQTNNIPWLIYDMGDMGDRIGLGVNYNITPAISVGLRVEEKLLRSVGAQASGARNYNNNSVGTGVQSGRPVRSTNSLDNDIPRSIDNSKGNY